MSLKCLRFKFIISIQYLCFTHLLTRLRYFKKIWNLRFKKENFWNKYIWMEIIMNWASELSLVKLQKLIKNLSQTKGLLKWHISQELRRKNQKFLSLKLLKNGSFTKFIVQKEWFVNKSQSSSLLKNLLRKLIYCSRLQRYLIREQWVLGSKVLMRALTKKCHWRMLIKISFEHFKEQRLKRKHTLKLISHLDDFRLRDDSSNAWMYYLIFITDIQDKENHQT